MNPLHGGNEVSGEPVKQILRYRLAVIVAFLLAVAAAGLADRAWHGQLGHHADEVRSTR